jgi:hypothetical protein
MTTQVMTEIDSNMVPIDDVVRYDRCVEKFVGRGLPPCHECRIDVRTACFKIKSIKKTNNTELSGTGSKTGFLRPEPDRVPTGNYRDKKCLTE